MCLPAAYRSCCPADSKRCAQALRAITSEQEHGVSNWSSSPPAGCCIFVAPLSYRGPHLAAADTAPCHRNRQTNAVPSEPPIAPDPGLVDGCRGRGLLLLLRSGAAAFVTHRPAAGSRHGSTLRRRQGPPGPAGRWQRGFRLRRTEPDGRFYPSPQLRPRW